MVCRILFLAVLLLCFTLPRAALATVEVEVKVVGVKGPLYDNILAGLAIYQHQRSPRLSAYDVTRLHNKAAAEIADALAPYGYFDPKIETGLATTAKGFVATYTVSPGPPVLVRDIRLNIATDQTDHAWFDQEKRLFPLHSGDIVDQGVYEDGKERMIRRAISLGYMNAHFALQELRIDRQARFGDIVLTLATGPLYLFGETGSTQKIIRPDLLQGYIGYQKGDPYQPSKMVELQKTLYRTGYFSRVIIQGQREKADGLYIPVVVDLAGQENLNRYSLGVGYATDTGARTRFDWHNSLLNESGHTMKGTAQISQYNNNLGLTYQIPRGNPNNDTYAFTTSYTDQNWEGTETRLLSAGAGLDHGGKLFRYGESIEIRDEQYSIGATEGQSTLLMPSLTGTLVRADDLLQPKTGLQLSLAVSGAVESFGSDTSFAKVLGSGKIILSPFAEWRLIGRGSLGATMVDSIDSLPPSLRFYAGGDNSVRGYSYKELGPVDSAGEVVGGRYLVDGSVEVEKTLSERWALATFWDVGNAMDDPTISFKQGVGAGVRFRLPFGQVRLDLASAILEDGSPFRLHLTVGADL